MVANALLSQAPTDVEATNQERYLDTLVVEAKSHGAINHVWLSRVASSSYADMNWVLQDFAREYHGYASCFPHYLRRVIDKLENPRHKALLLRNLEEEQGHMDLEDREALQRTGIDPDSVDGIAHPELFLRFCNALGISKSEVGQPSYAALSWREEFLRFLDNATPAAAVGALGLGTENIVRPVYLQLLSGIRKLAGLKREDYVFFELHCLVDDQHAVDLHHVALELLTDNKTRREMCLGMREALHLRERFWDHLDRRANSVLRVA